MESILTQFGVLLTSHTDPQASVQFIPTLALGKVCGAGPS